jgi:hypothetical protein
MPAKVNKLRSIPVPFINNFPFCEIISVNPVCRRAPINLFDAALALQMAGNNRCRFLK